MELTKEEIKFLYTVILSASFGGGLLDMAHGVKEKLKKEIDPKELKVKEKEHGTPGLGKPQ